MSKLTRSIIFGMLTALLAFGASAGLVAVGGYGPCGPASGISTAGVYLQMPAFFLIEMGLFRLPAPLDFAAICAIQAVVWSGVWFTFFRLRGLRKH